MDEQDYSSQNKILFNRDLSQLSIDQLENKIENLQQRIWFYMHKGESKNVYNLNVELSHIEAEQRLRFKDNNPPSHIKEMYYPKWHNLECCYLSNFHNLGEAWLSFGRTLSLMPKQIIIVPYDKIRFDKDYSYFTLDDHLSYANSSGKFVIIDKTVEHQHNETEYNDLKNKLEEHSLLSKCVVYDNTFTSKKYNEYGIPHVYAPWYVWFYIKYLKLPKYLGNPNYQFLCLNNYHKPHRLAIIKMLHDKKFIKRTNWSYREHANNPNKVNELYENFDENNLGFETPKFLDQPKGNFDQSLNLESLHNDALCSIVNESDYFYDGTQFATEKSLNAIFFSTIPIIVSCAGTVDVMRTHGIDVYDDIVDHSYDIIADPKQRFDEITKTIEQCASWRDYRSLRTQIAPRILRNQMLMTHTQHWQDEIDFATEKFFKENKISI